MKISSEPVDSRTAIKGSTRRIRELLKPSSYKTRERSCTKNQKPKQSGGAHSNGRTDKNQFIRGSLDFKAKNIAATLFRTEEFKNPKLGSDGSFFAQNQVRLGPVELERAFIVAVCETRNVVWDLGIWGFGGWRLFGLFGFGGPGNLGRKHEVINC